MEKQVKVTVESNGEVEMFEVDALIAGVTKGTHDDLKARSLVRGELTTESMVKGLSAILTYYIGRWNEEGQTPQQITENINAAQLRAIEQLHYWALGVNTKEEYEEDAKRRMMDAVGGDLLPPGPL